MGSQVLHDEWWATLLCTEGCPVWSFLRVAVDQVITIEVRTGRGYRQDSSGTREWVGLSQNWRKMGCRARSRGLVFHSFNNYCSLKNLKHTIDYNMHYWLNKNFFWGARKWNTTTFMVYIDFKTQCWRHSREVEIWRRLRDGVCVSEQLRVFGRKSIEAERRACRKLLREEGLLKKLKEGQWVWARRVWECEAGVSWGHLMKNLAG